MRAWGGGGGRRHRLSKALLPPWVVVVGVNLIKGLVTHYCEGGLQNRRGGGRHVKFYPYEKGGRPY